MMTSRPAVPDVVLVLAMLALAAWMCWPNLFTNWIPWDDGGMALSAERVLHGELPHRDFDDPWTGGWSYFQSALFRLGGVSLAMLRVPIFIVWLAGLFFAFVVARRFLGPVLSGLAVLSSATWSLFAWHLPLLNWYYAPLALATVWAVLRFEERASRGWLVLAGLCIGLSLLVKVTGLFLLAALLVWAVARAAEAPDDSSAGRATGFLLVAGVLLSLFVGAVVVLLSGLPREFYGAGSVHFLFPCVTVALWVFYRAWRGGSSAAVGSRTLVALLMPIAAGVLLALLPFLWRYWRADALHDLLEGVFVRPRVRLASVVYGPPGRMFTLLAAIPTSVLFFGAARAKGATGARQTWLAVALGASWGALSQLEGGALHDALVLSVRTVPVMLPLLAFVSDSREPMRGSRAGIVVLLVALTATSQLIQVPFAFLSYFLFAAMLSILATCAVVSTLTRDHGGILAFWCSFLLVAGGLPGNLPGGSERRSYALPLARAGIQVSYLDSVRWGRLDAFMRQRPARAILVIGNAPEVPFLLGRASATRAIYDVLSDSAERDVASLVLALERKGGKTVIIGHLNGSWAKRSLAAAPALRLRFPSSRMFWPYEVRWSSGLDTIVAATPDRKRGKPPHHSEEWRHE